MAKPKLALIPSSQGSKLYSVLPSSGVGDFDFSRSGGATRINSQGLIETVASGVSRLNYPMIDGVVNGCPSHLLEPQSTNSLTYSQELNDSNWSTTRLNVLANQIISPDGTLNADLLTPTASTFDYSIGQVPLINYNSQESTVSFFAKFNGYNISLSLAGAPTNWTGCIFDLENGIARTPQNSGAQSLCTSKIENYGNGWYRCSVTFTPYSSGAFYTFWGTVDSTDANLGSFGLQSYTSDGISGVYLWGCQSEVGQSYPTSYIPTNGSSVTRSAETATNSGDASTFNDSEGVLMVETQRIFNGGHYSSIFLDGGDLNNYIGILYRVNTNEVWLQVVKGGTQQFSKRLYNIKHDENNKFAIKYENTSFNWYLNGFLIATSTASGMPFSPNTLNNISFQASNNSEPYYGSTKQLQYFDSALNDSDLETLTSWVSFSDMANGQLYTIE